MLLPFFFLLVSAEYTRFPASQRAFTVNGFNDQFVDWRGPGFALQGRDWDGLCATSKTQSPIDITDYPPSLLQVVSTSNSTFSPIYFQSREEPLVVQFNGLYDMYYMFAGTSRQVVAGVTTQRILSDVAFKVPAEHTLNGVRYPMSVLLGYSGVLPNGDLSLGYQITVLIREGAPNPGLSQFLSQSPMDVSAFLPLSKVLDDYYDYVGSFDIPPCWEDVPWVISSYIVEASRGQIEYFQKLYGASGGNARAIQPRNGRTIYHFIPNSA